MKKLLVIVASLMLCAAANAQETFYPGWVFGVQAGVNYTAGHGNFGKLLSYPTVALNAGYEFTPWFALRGDLSGWQAKGVTAFEEHANRQAVYFSDPLDYYKFNYVQLAIDAKFDICNIFRYKSTRFLSPYVFVGVGGNLRFNNGAKDIAYVCPVAGNAFYWDKATLAVLGRVGVGFEFRVSEAVKITLEAVDNILPNKFNSTCDNGFNFFGANKHLDANVSALLGVKFAFGQAKARAAAAAAAAAEAAAAKAAAERAAAEAAARAAAEKAAAEAAAERAAAERAAAERAAAEAAAAKKAAYDKAVAEINAAFAGGKNCPLFIIGRYNITRDARKKVETVAEIIKANPEMKFHLTGYADKETGSAAGNWKLSENRANAIAEALVEAGIPAAQLVTSWKGDTEVPFEGAKPAQKRTVTFKAE